jgi:hypothetical protein
MSIHSCKGSGHRNVGHCLSAIEAAWSIPAGLLCDAVPQAMLSGETRVLEDVVIAGMCRLSKMEPNFQQAIRLVQEEMNERVVERIGDGTSPTPDSLDEKDVWEVIDNLEEDAIDRMKRKWGLQFAYQIIPSSTRPASSEPIFDRWFKMALPYFNQISASPHDPKTIRQLFEHKFKTRNTREKLKGRNRFKYIQEIDLQNLAKDLNGPSDSEGSSIQPQGAQAQGRAPETGQGGAQANRGPAIPPANVQVTESHGAAP